MFIKNLFLEKFFCFNNDKNLFINNTFQNILIDVFVIFLLYD